MRHGLRVPFFAPASEGAGVDGQVNVDGMGEDERRAFEAVCRNADDATVMKMYLDERRRSESGSAYSRDCRDLAMAELCRRRLTVPE